MVSEDVVILIQSYIIDNKDNVYNMHKLSALVLLVSVPILVVTLVILEFGDYLYYFIVSICITHA